MQLKTKVQEDLKFILEAALSWCGESCENALRYIKLFDYFLVIKLHWCHKKVCSLKSFNVCTLQINEKLGKTKKDMQSLLSKDDENFYTKVG